MSQFVLTFTYFAAFGFPQFASCYSFCNGLYSECCE